MRGYVYAFKKKYNAKVSAYVNKVNDGYILEKIVINSTDPTLEELVKIRDLGGVEIDAGKSKNSTLDGGEVQIYFLKLFPKLYAENKDELKGLIEELLHKLDSYLNHVHSLQKKSPREIEEEELSDELGVDVYLY